MTSYPLCTKYSAIPSQTHLFSISRLIWALTTHKTVYYTSIFNSTATFTSTFTVFKMLKVTFRSTLQTNRKVANLIIYSVDFSYTIIETQRRRPHFHRVLIYKTGRDLLILPNRKDIIVECLAPRRFRRRRNSNFHYPLRRFLCGEYTRSSPVADPPVCYNSRITSPRANGNWIYSARDVCVCLFIIHFDVFCSVTTVPTTRNRKYGRAYA